MNKKVKNLLNVGIDSLKKVGKKVKIDIEIELKKADIKEIETKIGKIVYSEQIKINNSEIEALVNDINKKQEEIKKLKEKEKEDDD